MKRSKVLISIAILTLITTSLACSFFGGKSSEDIVATDSGAALSAPESATGDNQAAESDEPQNAASANLGEEYRSEEGGYAFRPIPDYQLEEFFGLASMTAPLIGTWLANIDYGLLFALSAAVNLVAFVALRWRVRDPRWTVTATPQPPEERP